MSSSMKYWNKNCFLSSNNFDNDEYNSNDDVSTGGDGGGDGKGVVRFEYAQRIHYAG